MIGPTDPEETASRLNRNISIPDLKNQSHPDTGSLLPMPHIVKVKNRHKSANHPQKFRPVTEF